MNASDERLYNEVLHRVAIYNSPGQQLHRTLMRALEGPTVAYGTPGADMTPEDVRKSRQRLRFLSGLGAE